MKNFQLGELLPIFNVLSFCFFELRAVEHNVLSSMISARANN